MTSPKKTSADARLVLTLDFHLSEAYRGEFPSHNRDAMNIVRTWIAEIGDCDKNALKLNLERLLDNADSWKLEVAR